MGGQREWGRRVPRPPRGGWDPHPSATFHAKDSRREVGAQRMPGPVCPSQGPRGLWAGAYGANPGRLRGGGGQSPPGIGRSRERGRGRKCPDAREPESGERQQSCSSGGTPARAPPRPIPTAAGCVALSGCLTSLCASMLLKAVVNVISPLLSSRLSSHLLLLITPPDSRSPKPGSGSSFHPRPWASALGPPSPCSLSPIPLSETFEAAAWGPVLQYAPRPPFAPTWREGCEC